MQPTMAQKARPGRAIRGRFSLILAPFAGGVLALALYARTLPTGLTWAHNGADGGDLLAAALTAGVPHPTGYPTYQILLRLAIAVLPGEPARAGAWLSAVCAALAVALLVDLAQRTLRRSPGRDLAAACAALIAGLAWAVSPIVWGQATIVEVYALNALFCVAVLWLAWRWGEAVAAGEPTGRWLASGGLVLGLGLGNHLTLVLVAPGLAAWLWLKGRGRRELPRELGTAALMVLAGLLVYAYLPLAAAGRPAINWGDPVTLDRFLWVVTGRLYAPLAFGLPAAQLPARLAGWATTVVGQFLPWGLLLALGGLVRLEGRLRAWWIATLLIWLSFTAYAIPYNSTDSDAYLIPAFAVMALWLAEGLAALLTWVGSRGAPALRVGLGAVLALAAVVALAAGPAAWNWEDHDPRHDWMAQATVSAARDAAPGAVILTAGDRDTFALWYAVYGLRERPDVAVVNVSLFGYDWYHRSLAHTHPDLLPSGDSAADLEALIPGWLMSRPVYVAEDIGLPLRLGARVAPSAILRPVIGPDP